MLFGKEGKYERLKYEGYPNNESLTPKAQKTFPHPFRVKFVET